MVKLLTQSNNYVIIPKRPKRRDVRVVDGDGPENRCAKAPWVRIPLSPPFFPSGKRKSLKAVFSSRTQVYNVQSFGVEKYPSGRRGSPAKGVVRDERSEGSNPSFSAKNPQCIDNTVHCGFLYCQYCPTDNGRPWLVIFSCYPLGDPLLLINRTLITTPVF